MDNITNTTPGWLKGGQGISLYANVSFRTAQNWIASGRLPVRRLSARLIMCKPEDVDAFIESEAHRFEEAAL